MTTITVPVPVLGESITEATVARWINQVGDSVMTDEPVVELETDKVTVEARAPQAGVIVQLFAKVGETVGVGKPLLAIDTDS